jgi:hypothetical protein
VVRANPTSPIVLKDVFNNPTSVAARLPGQIWGLTSCDVLFATAKAIGMRLHLEPWRGFDGLGYPVEEAGLLILANGAVFATPHHAADRTWIHRNPHSDFRELCLWDEADEPSLRWVWADGLVSLVTIIHRHLIAEEYARRHGGAWPAEDAPHGSGQHPIRSFATWLAVERWRR